MKLPTWLAMVCVLSAGAAGAQTMPAIDFGNAPSVAALVRDLGSDDFATRDRAQRLLDATPIAARDALAKLAESTQDIEAQSRLQARVELLDDLRVTSQPPLSLDLKDASLAEVAAALARATGQEMSAPGVNADRFTLKVDQVPFWEAYRQLSAQHAFWFNVGVNDIRVNANVLPWRDIIISRGLAVLRQDLKPPPALPAGVPASTIYTTTLGLGIDPRICILQHKPPEFAPAIDNAGGRWTALATTTSTATISLGRGITFTRPITLEPAGPKVGRVIASLRGTFPIVVQSRMESHAFDPAKDALDAPFVVGPLRIAVTRCAIAGGVGAGNANVQFDLTVRPDTDSDPLPFPLGPVTVNIFDATGRPVIVRTLPLGFIGSMANSLNVPATGPITMRLDVTTAVREVKVPFEFKDIPVP